MTLLKKSQDEKSNKADKKSLKRGGQKGHQGKTLEQVKNPDKVERYSNSRIQDICI